MTSSSSTSGTRPITRARVARLAVLALVLGALVAPAAAASGAALSGAAVQDGPSGPDGADTSSSDEQNDSADSSTDTSDQTAEQAEERRRRALQNEQQTEQTEQPDRGEQVEGEPETVLREVDTRLRVVSAEWDAGNETFTVGLANVGDGTSSVTITEAIQSGEGSSTFGIEQLTVRGGERVDVDVDVRPDDDGVGGVMITTERSISQGSGEYIERGGSDDASLFSGDATWRDVRASAVFSIAVCIALLVLIAWHVVAKRHEDVKEVDMDA